MARLEAQSKLLYYPTPPAVVETDRLLVQR